MAFIECVNDECPAIIRKRSTPKVIKAWNTRPIEDSLRKQLEIAVEALKKIRVDDGSMYDMIATDALAEIEKVKDE